MKTSLVSTLMAVFLLLASSVSAFEYPASKGKYVNDLAGVVKDQALILQLEKRLKDFEAATDHKLVIVVVKELGGQDIEGYARELQKRWNLEVPTKGRSLLFLISLKERHQILSLGYALEKESIALLKNYLLDYKVAPYLKQGKFGQALDSGSQAIMQSTVPDYLGTDTHKSQAISLKDGAAIFQPDEQRSATLRTFVMIGLALLLLMFMSFIARRIFAGLQAREYWRSCQVRNEKEVRAKLLAAGPILRYYRELPQKQIQRFAGLSPYYRQKAEKENGRLQEKFKHYEERVRAFQDLFDNDSKSLCASVVEVELEGHSRALTQSEQAIERLIREYYSLDNDVQRLLLQIEDLSAHLLRAAIAIPDADKRAEFKASVKEYPLVAKQYCDRYDGTSDLEILRDSLLLLKTELVLKAKVVSNEQKVILVIPDNLTR